MGLEPLFPNEYSQENDVPEGENSDGRYNLFSHGSEVLDSNQLFDFDTDILESVSGPEFPESESDGIGALISSLFIPSSREYSTNSDDLEMELSNLDSDEEV